MGLQFSVRVGHAFWIDWEPIVIQKISKDRVTYQVGSSTQWTGYDEPFRHGASVLTFGYRYSEQQVGVHVLGRQALVSRRSPMEHCCNLPLVDFDRRYDGILISGCEICGSTYLLLPRNEPAAPFERHASKLHFGALTQYMFGKQGMTRKELKARISNLWDLPTWKREERELFSYFMTFLNEK